MIEPSTVITHQQLHIQQICPTYPENGNFGCSLSVVKKRIVTIILLSLIRSTTRHVFSDNISPWYVTQ